MGRRRHVPVLGAALVVVLAAAGYALWRWPDSGLLGWFERPAGPALIVVSGNIEAHQSVLSFTRVEAPIVALPFDEGAEIKRGTVLARVDDRTYRQQVAIDEASLKASNAQVGVDESKLAAAKQIVVSDEFDLAQKERDYGRAEALAKRSVTSIQARDLAMTAARQSAANLARDRALANVAAATLAVSRANESVAAAKLKADEITLGYTTLTAPFKGVIAVRQAELGELAGPGVAIVTLDDLDHVWLRAYVNEPDLGKVRLGEPAAVTTDTYPGKIYNGRISFISPQAEFTPKTVETHAQRVMLVYRIRIDIDNRTHELLPGMPADARIKLLPP